MQGRHSLALAALLLAACSVKGEQGRAAPSAGGSEAASASAAPETVACALKGASAYKDQCTIERSESEGKRYILLRHPDGGFRRLEELEAGKRYKSVDGADEVAVDANGNDLELTIGDDHYLFPGPQPAPQTPASQSNAPKS